jgi:hypothetical protein
MASTSAPLYRSFLLLEVWNKERTKSLVQVCAKMFTTAKLQYLIEILYHSQQETTAV